ncbi:MAG: alpha/beta hydrolase [Desulfohalobiaceae bacterium]|nr:alpha/beta hydrolase [Desulfohalobiaceae bacterium]
MTSLTPDQTTAGPCRINRIRHPAAGKKPVIFLHGASFEAQTWLNLGTLDLLKDNGYPVHALDMPGFGRSEPCAAAETEIIQAYISAENLEKPVIVGPSRGGRYALETYFAHPEGIGGLVLVGSVGIAENESRFKDIRVPCLLVWGSEDTVSNPENGRFLDREIPDSKLVILDGAPHPCYLEKADPWHKSLLSFLREKFG